MGSSSSSSVSDCIICCDTICNSRVFFCIYRVVESVLLYHKWVVCIVMVLFVGVCVCGCVCVCGVCV